MKRKRVNDHSNDRQFQDQVVLVDINGKSIRASRALLMDKSDYFAKLLGENNLEETQLNERYLVELINYLYDNEIEENSETATPTDDNNPNQLMFDQNENDDDVEILMQLLALSKKYSFNQLHRKLMIEINLKLSLSSVLRVYCCAGELGIKELQESTRIMILSWLPQLQNSQLFYNLTEESINDIYSVEPFNIDNECKLNALSAWWSHNKKADMTNLWFKLITCSDK